MEQPCKLAGMGQYRASTGPMLAASAQCWPGTGPLWHVYGASVAETETPTLFAASRDLRSLHV